MANRKGSGRGGRKPKPTAIKIMDGTRADRLNVGEPKAPGGPLEPPPWVAGDSIALEGWNRVVDAVGRLGLASPVDADAVSVFAVAFARWRRALEDTAKDGLTIEGARGGRITHPAVGIAERAERQMISVLSLFGLNPSDRSRLKATEQGEADPFEAFLKKSREV